MSVPNFARTPSAMARATGSLTAVKRSRFLRYAEFAMLYLVRCEVTARREEITRSGNQANAVRDQARPVMLSAVATVFCFSRIRRATAS